MGSTSVFRTFKGNKEAVEKAFENAQQDDRYENGHSYSGGFGQFTGIEFHDKEFASRREAEDYIDIKGNKWGPAIAVRFKDGEETGASKKKHEALRKKHLDLELKSNQLHQEAFKQFQNAKSKTAGCKACGSKLNRKNIVGGFREPEPICICRASLYGDTTKKRLATIKAKVAEARKAVNDYIPAFSTTEIAWAVGGWVSC
jgi:hypothetical protein